MKEGRAVAETPGKAVSKAEDWLNRIIVLVIALASLILGIPLVLMGVSHLLMAVMTGDWEFWGMVALLPAGLLANAFGVIIGWSALVPKARGKKVAT